MLSELEFAKAKKRFLLAAFQGVVDECLEFGLSKAETEQRINRMLEMLTKVSNEIKDLESRKK